MKQSSNHRAPRFDKKGNRNDTMNITITIGNASPSILYQMWFDRMEKILMTRVIGISNCISKDYYEKKWIQKIITSKFGKEIKTYR
jgi:hypothetical protein